MAGSDSINMQEDASSPLDEAKEQTLATDGKMNTRHARWTGEETIVLLQAKLAVENRVRARNRSSSIFASDQNEPKWDSVSSYCKQRGVSREAVQCQKRRGNVLGDFKKIKTWESHLMKEAESFWKLRSDSRRERKLPSLFDREVYEILDGRGCAMAATPLEQIKAMAEDEAAAEEHQVNEDEEAEDIGLAYEGETIATRGPMKTVKKGSPPISGAVKEKSMARTGLKMQEGLKRRLLSINGSEDINWAKVFERNSIMINSQLEAQNINYQLDREQRKELADNLVAALNKLTDAVVRIANKL